LKAFLAPKIRKKKKRKKSPAVRESCYAGWAAAGGSQ